MNPSKRLFLRTCLAAAGGAALGLHRCSLSGAVIPFSPFSAHGDDEPWKWSKEALYYARTGRGVRCVRCPNFCELEDGEAGKCRNRVNYRGVLYTIAYGNPCAVHIDPIEKKPFFHFLPATKAFSIATAGCVLGCKFCQNSQISQANPEDVDTRDLPPADVVRQAAFYNCRSITYTYTEPLENATCCLSLQLPLPYLFGSCA